MAKEENADVEDDEEAKASVIAVEVFAALRSKLWGHILKKTMKRQFIFDSDENVYLLVETVAEDVNAMYVVKVVEVNSNNDKAKETINETIKKY